MDRQIPQQQNFWDDLCGLSALAAAVLLLYATSIWGPAISNDSFSYLMAAHNFAHGNGLAVPRVGELVPMTSWPPLFPSAISLLGFLGVEIKEAARWLNTFLMAMNVLLAARLIRRTTNSGISAFFGAVFLALSPTLLRAHSHVWSEPLFFFLSLSGLSFLAEYCRKPSLLWAACFGTAAGLSSITRYAGLSLAMTGIIAILFLTDQKLRRKLSHCVAAALPAVLPITIWFLRNSTVAGNIANRRISFRLPAVADIQSVLGDVSLWLLPKNVPPLVRSGAMAMAGVALLWLVIEFLRRRPWRNEAATGTIFLVFIACYETLVLVMSFFVDSSILAEERIQLPVLIALVIFVMTTAASLYQSRTYARILVVSAAIFAVLCAGRSLVWASYTHTNGQAFSSARWACSPTIEQIKMLSPDTQIFSNSPQIVYAQTGRVAWVLPRRTDFTRLPNPRWKEDMGSLRKSFSAQKSFVVVFTAIGNDRDYPVERDIETGLNVRRIYEGPDGIIFARPD
jgi:hypothetical protein